MDPMIAKVVRASKHLFPLHITALSKHKLYVSETIMKQHNNDNSILMTATLTDRRFLFNQSVSLRYLRLSSTSIRPHSTFRTDAWRLTRHIITVITFSLTPRDSMLHTAIYTQYKSTQTTQTSAKKHSLDTESWSGVLILIMTPDLDDLQNVMGTSLSKDTSVIKFSWKSNQFFQRYEPNCGKMPNLATLKNPLKNCWIWIQMWMTSKI